MKIISQAECEEWLADNIAKGLSRRQVEAGYAHYVAYKLPVNTGPKTSLAHALTHFVEIGQHGLFWITDWGIFPSTQNMALFDGYRKSLGEDRAIHAAPGHVFDEADSQQLECLFDLSLYFYWDVSVFDRTGTFLVKTSHDGYISFHARDGARLERFRSSLDRYKLEPFSGVP
jgi:hypothetical protein